MGSGGVDLPTLMNYLEEAIGDFPDSRTGSNSRYAMRTVALAAFSVFFTQSPSVLAHQRSMQLSKGKSNASTIFGVNEIPTDNHIRSLLDPVYVSLVQPVFKRVFNELHERKALKALRCFDETLLVALDGVWFHNSESVHCHQCNTQSHRDGRTTYYHSAVTPVIVSPGNTRVISLEPQFIEPQDGQTKQDCENAAGKRWLRGAGLSYVQHGVTILGDDLYCNQPMCELLLEHDYNFILSSSPRSNTLG